MGSGKEDCHEEFFFQSLCADSDLASTLTIDLKETVYLDKRVLNDQRKFVDWCMGSYSPLKHDKYTLFTWKVKGRWGLPKEKRPIDMREGDWTHVKRDGRIILPSVPMNFCM